MRKTVILQTLLCPAGMTTAESLSDTLMAEGIILEDRAARELPPNSEFHIFLCLPPSLKASLSDADQDVVCQKLADEFISIQRVVCHVLPNEEIPSEDYLYRFLTTYAAGGDLLRHMYSRGIRQHQFRVEPGTVVLLAEAASKEATKNPAFIGAVQSDIIKSMGVAAEDMTVSTVSDLLDKIEKENG